MRLIYDYDKKIWREALDSETPTLTIDNFVLKKLDNIKLLQREDWDTMFIICGDEGSGKSTFSFICGQYLSNMSLSLDNIGNGTDDAMSKLKRLPDESVLILDEAELLFASRNTMTKEQKQLTQILMIIRQKRMTLILVTPDFHELSKYVAIKRSRFVMRCFAVKNRSRGYFAYWGTKKKAKLFYEGKKNFGSYRKPKPEFYGFFTNYKLPFDDEYKKVKFDTLMLAFESAEQKKERKKKEKYDEEQEQDEQEQDTEQETNE